MKIKEVIVRFKAIVQSYAVDEISNYTSELGVDNEFDIEALAQRLHKVREFLHHEREYGNDWRINYWTIVERQLRRKWEMLVQTPALYR